MLKNKRLIEDLMRYPFGFYIKLKTVFSIQISFQFYSYFYLFGFRNKTMAWKIVENMMHGEHRFIKLILTLTKQSQLIKRKEYLMIDTYTNLRNISLFISCRNL